jgi:cysteine desulfurase/selenocysteine lyase
MIEQRSSLVPRNAFPLLAGRDIAYLDSAASAQKPKAVLDRMRQFYETSYANIHRAVYPLSEAATEAYESARARVARFLRAPSADSIVFTRNATEAVNLVANSSVRGSRAATAFSSRRSSTMPTSCRGNCCATDWTWT